MIIVIVEEENKKTLYGFKRKGIRFLFCVIKNKLKKRVVRIFKE